jgi:MFS family permease
VTSSPATPTQRIPRTVWALGLVSLLMDTSSEIVHALLPLFMTVQLGLSVAMLGLIDGVAEATASITKLFSGYISDRFGRRKPLILIGYGLAAVTKPVFAIAGSAGLVFGARFADRIGKGLRGAPRDALIADVTAPELRGRAFGLRQSLDTVGAFAGPLLAVGLMFILANDIRAIFWMATIPAALAVLVIIIAVRDVDAPKTTVRVPLKLADLRSLPRAYWAIVALGAVLTLARFSEAFLILKANAAYPAGHFADRMAPARLLGFGIFCLIAADLVLALTSGLIGITLGLILWGAHMALTQGLLAKLVADHAPAHLRGSAFGMFNLATGIALLFASVIAGLLWDRFGADMTFFAGAGFATVALLLASRYPQTAQSEPA